MPHLKGVNGKAMLKGEEGRKKDKVALLGGEHDTAGCCNYHGTFKAFPYHFTVGGLD